MEKRLVLFCLLFWYIIGNKLLSRRDFFIYSRKIAVRLRCSSFVFRKDIIFGWRSLVFVWEGPKKHIMCLINVKKRRKTAVFIVDFMVFIWFLVCTFFQWFFFFLWFLQILHWQNGIRTHLCVHMNGMNSVADSQNGNLDMMISFTTFCV